MVTAKAPHSVGVPESTPVVELRLTPAGKVPVVTEKVGAGAPVPVTVKDPAEPMVKVVWSAEVMDGAELVVMAVGQKPG